MASRNIALSVDIPREQWLSSNMRLHWAPKAKRTAWIRGHFQALASCYEPFTAPVRIVAHIGYATASKADPANAYPCVKAAVDGCVTAGLLVEDSHEWVVGPDMRRDPIKAPKGFHTVRLEIEEIARKSAVERVVNDKELCDNIGDNKSGPRSAVNTSEGQAPIREEPS